MARFVTLSALLALFFSAVTSPAGADGHITGRIIDIDDSDFPTVRVVLSIAETGGRPITGLEPPAFEAQEAGAAAKVATVQSVVDQRIGVAVVLTIDSSGSMAGNAITQAKAAAGTFVRSLQPADQAAVIAFADNVTVEASLSQDRGAALGALDRVQATGNTALYTSVGRSIELARSAQLARRAVILLSDGLDFGGVSTVSRDDSIRLAAEGGVPIYAIGLGAGIDRAYLEQIAGQSGGAFFAAPNPASIPAIYQQLAELLRSQYVVTLESTGEANTKERSVSFHVNTPAGPIDIRADYATRRNIPDPTAVPPPVVVPTTEEEGGGGSSIVLMLFGAAVVLAAMVGSGRYFQSKARERKLAEHLALMSARAVTELQTRPEGGAPLPGAGAVSLVITDGPHAGRHFSISEEPLTIGSGEACQIRLEGVADQYARVWYRDGRVMLHQLAGRRPGSRDAGGWLSLGPGDTLEVGPHTLGVQAGAAAPTADS